MYENIKIISKSEMDGIEIGMDNPDGTKCPLGTLTWYGEDDCNAEQDEAFARKICQAYNSHDELVEVIEAALRIKDIWTLPTDEECFRDEAQALQAMLDKFEQALANSAKSPH